MALVKSTSQLDHALAEFNGKLTPEEKVRFRTLPSGVPDASAVITLTAQLDQGAEQRRGRCIASRLFPLLASVQQSSGVVSTFVSSNPAVAALVWGSVQFMLHLANRSFAYFDLLSHLLIDIGKLCPRFTEYQGLYRNAPRLQSALSDFYAEIIRCCTHVCDVLRAVDWLSSMRNIFSSFESGFGPFRAKLQALAHDVEAEISLAEAKASDEERKAQGLHRTMFVSSMREKRDRHLQKQKQADVTRRQHLLDALSTYDQNIGYGQALRKRYKGTAEWLSRTQEFQDWMFSDRGSAIFWLSGKLGCGKTVLLASAVEQLFLRRSTPVAYFFCRAEENASLQATTILRSIVRQCLSANTLPNKVEIALAELQKKPLVQASDLIDLLRLTMRSSFMVIDGIDECAESERRALFSALGDVLRSDPDCLKLMLSSRSKITKRLHSSSGKIFELPLHDSAITPDITIYVVGELEDRLNSGNLVFGDPALVSHIRDALITGAEGMFLWVVLQMDEICYQDCDRDVRAAVASLPKTLEKTYIRMLERISTRQRSRRTKEIFQWTMAAKRPLTLYELQEALAVEKYSSYSQPERFINDIAQITSWCEGFLTLDEVSNEVYFAHPTMKRSLVQYYAGLNQNSFSLMDVDKEAGEICVTYLNFNDFKTQLVKRNATQDVAGEHVIQALLATLQTTSLGRRMAKPLKRMTEKSPSPSKPIGHLLQTQAGGRAGDAIPRREQYPFLAYASQHWLAHSSNFEESDRIWPMWRRLLLDGSNAKLTHKPWTTDAWAARDDSICHSIAQHDHVALLRFIESSDTSFSGVQLNLILDLAAAFGKLGLLSRLIKGDEDTGDLYAASRRGHKAAVQALLDAGADVNVQGGGYGNALQAALMDGYDSVVKLLLDAGADVNAQGGEFGNALQAAALGGYKEIAKLLLDIGADVNAQGGYLGNALQAAAVGGHKEIAKLLLDAGADVNAQGGFYNNALQAQAAADRDYKEIAKLLLDIGADVNAQGGYFGNALQAAAVRGYKEIAKLLLDAGADANAQGGYFGNALQAAAVGGYPEIAELLLDAGADVNAQGGEYGNALQAASNDGHESVVKLLLDAGADVNAQGGFYTNALQAAAVRDYKKIAKLLLNAGADANAQGGYLGNALQTAAVGGHKEIAKLLLDAGADVNAQGGEYGNALQAASKNGYDSVVKLLRSAGARDTR